MHDVVEKIGHSVVQHGKLNDRIYLMKLDKADFPGIIDVLEKTAREKGYGKIFAKVPGWAREIFERAGYIEEAFIPCFYNVKEPAGFLARYPDRERAVVGQDKLQEILRIIETAKNRAEPPLPAAIQTENYFVRLLAHEDLPALAALYKAVFQSYPFPIFDPGYLKETMADNVLYFGAFSGGTLCAASSADMDVYYKNAEMTDFATDPAHRGGKLALRLLGTMEQEMNQRGIKTLYTIARSHSAGINTIFAKAGFRYAGMLRNNTNISGRIESMNVWYKLIG